jgi:hypothetical protein
VSWPLVYRGIAEATYPEGDQTIGWCYHAPFLAGRESIGARYKALQGSRAPILIWTPAGWWCSDQMARDSMRWYGDGWSVTGDLPAITVTPSINFVGAYHGWVTAGVLTDDCDGRKFP